MTRPLLVLLFVGLLIRLGISPRLYSGDIHNHISWAREILAGRSSGIYGRDFYFSYGTLTPNYPPLALYGFTSSLFLYQSAVDASWWLNLRMPIFPSRTVFLLEDFHSLPAFMKITPILADIGIAVLIYRTMRRLLSRSGRVSLLASGLFLFNPAVVYLSSAWGQIESLPVFFTLAAFYYLFSSSKFLLPAVFFALALLSKQTAVLALPVFALAFFLRHGFFKSTVSCALAALLFRLLFLPFTQAAFSIYLNRILLGGISDYASYHAFNLWGLVDGFRTLTDARAWLGLSYYWWGWLIFAVVYLIVLSKRAFSPPAVFFALTLVQFAAFAFLTRVHERHLFPVLPFLLLAPLPGIILYPAFAFLTFLHFSNLYHNWWDPSLSFLITFLSSPSNLRMLTAVSIPLFIFLFTRYIIDS